MAPACKDGLKPPEDKPNELLLFLEMCERGLEDTAGAASGPFNTFGGDSPQVNQVTKQKSINGPSMSKSLLSLLSVVLASDMLCRLPTVGMPCTDLPMGKLVAGPVCGPVGRVRDAGAGAAVVAPGTVAGVVNAVAAATVVGAAAGVGNVSDAPGPVAWRLANGRSARGLAALTYGAVIPGATRSRPPVEDLTDTIRGAVGRAPCGAMCLGAEWGMTLGTGGCAGITML